METKKQAKARFVWNEENTKVIVDAYLTQKEADHAKANSSEFRAKLAAEVGAKSAHSVLSKLASEGVYIAIEPSANPNATRRRTKPVIASEIGAELERLGVSVDEKATDTLSNSNAEALEAVLSGLRKAENAAE